GTIPSKTLREAILFFERRRNGHAEHRPTAAEVLARVDGVVAREAEVIEDQLRRNDVTLLWGEASFIDPHTLVVQAEGEWRKISAASVLLAVGTRATPPPGVPEDGTVILTSDAIVDLKSLPRTMAVVGGGVIGIEYASMFAALDV